MSTVKDVTVPNIGDFQGVEVIEVLVNQGDKVSVEDPLLTLETEKATMDIPSPIEGVVEAVMVNAGDKVSEGDLIVKIKSEATEVAQTAPTEVKEEEKASDVSEKETQPQTQAPAKTLAKEENIVISLPQTDDFKDVTVIEILVNPGDVVEKEQSLIALESEKASLELPSQNAGTVQELFVKVGDKANPGTKVLSMLAKVEGETVAPASEPKAAPAPAAPPTKSVPAPLQSNNGITFSGEAHAGPATRKFARSLGVDLSKVQGSGKRGRITTEDVEKFVKSHMQQQGGVATSGTGIPVIPDQDFTQFGEIEAKPLNRIKKLTARNMSRNWLNLPHVTQFDDADVTDMEGFRKDNKQAALDNGIRLTPLSFIVKAAVSALQTFPQFNSSITQDGEQIIYKKYFNVGVAVDTPNGLLVPVIKDADKKGLFEIAKEIGELSEKAKKGTLKASDMQGNTFTISSLGNLGGTQFTPIINAPDVAILGVSRLDIKPVWQGDKFVPRKMLPLALSYDHRVIDGVEGAKFMAHLCAKLQDIRKLLL